MKLFRRLGFALWLALALVAGQHAALLHDLGHAAESLAQKHDGQPSPKCDKHYAFGQLVGTASTSFSIPVVCDVAAFAFLDSGAPLPRALAYRSQAPPAFLA